MKTMRIFAAAAGLLCAVSLLAQEGRPERPGRPGPREPMSDSLWAATRTQEMVEKYGLSPEQEGQVFNLNVQYADKLNFQPPQQEGERKDPRSMTEEERQAFFQQMQERRGEMQERMQQMQESRKAYEKELEGVLTKDQLKAYRKDRRKQEAEMQRRMQGGRPGGMGGPGMGGPGGMGGNRGGGFGGGGFGGGFGGEF